MQIADALARLLARAPLSEAESEAIFSQLLGGNLDPAQIAALLALLQAKGVTTDELVGAAKVMRSAVLRVAKPPAATVIDTCGTGGAPKAFNISTIAAIVAAAAGRSLSPVVCVAKHGNRSRSGRGSAEVLAGLGVNVDAPPDAEARCLQHTGVCFCFAIHHHPAMKHASAPRKALAFPTIFNLLGPLTNPAGADRQLIGVYARPLVELMAQALARLVARRAMVVHGHDGLDELTTTGPSFIAHVESANVRTEIFDPASLGIPRARPEDLVARDLPHAVEIARDVIAGKPGPARDIVALNAAAALLVADAAADFSAAFKLASSAIDSGAAQQTLDSLIAASKA